MLVFGRSCHLAPVETYSAEVHMNKHGLTNDDVIMARNCREGLRPPGAAT
jgi:hypothetical protein